jgi:hypothetical protein
MSIKNGGPAFPVDRNAAHLIALAQSRKDDEQDYIRVSQEAACGMSLRDYFAAKAMQGLLSADMSDKKNADVARWSYAMADAMLITREVQK